MSAWIAIGAVALALLGTARAQAQSAPEPADLRRWTFTVEKVHYQILLPKSATGMARVDSFVGSLSPRLMRRLYLGPAPRAGARTYAHVKRLSNAAVLRYKVEYNIGGGSGGSEAELQGVLEIGTHVLAVTCLDQDDLYTPRPEWCLQFLHHLKADPDTN